MSESWRHPAGWQGVLRTSGNRGLLVVHGFGDAPGRVSVPLPGEGWRAVEWMGAEPKLEGEACGVALEDFSGGVVLLERD